MAKAAKPTKGHNRTTEQEQYEEQQFLRAFGEIADIESSMAGEKGDLAAIYGRMKAIGFSKADFKFAKSLRDKDVGQIIEDFQRKIRISKMFGHQLGRQAELFDKDRSTAEERAYDEGLAVGKLRGDASNPYDPSSKPGQEWQRGLNDGNEFINKDLADAVAGGSE